MVVLVLKHNMQIFLIVFSTFSETKTKHLSLLCLSETFHSFFTIVSVFSLSSLSLPSSATTSPSSLFSQFLLHWSSKLPSSVQLSLENLGSFYCFVENENWMFISDAYEQSLISTFLVDDSTKVTHFDFFVFIFYFFSIRYYWKLEDLFIDFGFKCLNDLDFDSCLC